MLRASLRIDQAQNPCIYNDTAELWLVDSFRTLICQQAYLALFILLKWNCKITYILFIYLFYREERSAFKMRRLHENMEDTERQLNAMSDELHRRRSRDKYHAQHTAADFVYGRADKYSLQDFI